MSVRGSLSTLLSEYFTCIEGVGNYTCECHVSVRGSSSTLLSEYFTCIEGVGNYTCECPGKLINLTE